MIDRRAFITVVGGGILASPLAAEARQGRVPRIGIILSNRPLVPEKDDWSVQAFLEGFREKGWIDGQNGT